MARFLQPKSCRSLIIAATLFGNDLLPAGFSALDRYVRARHATERPLTTDI